MKQYYFTIITILLFGLLSCSNEETKTQNQVVARPTIPITSSEVRIGNQIWMTKNLNVSRYRNGDPIPQVTDPTQWYNLTTGAWCYYGNNAANGAVYGKLYNWFAVNDSRGLAPAGWHVATRPEWTTMSNYLGGEALATLKIKNWGFCANPLNTNASGFTALPGGYRNYDGPFYSVGGTGYFWTATGSTLSTLAVDMVVMCAHLSSFTPEQRAGFSVRCVKN
jgi:uncharacterized protein (TIGR02145 family)